MMPKANAALLVDVTLLAVSILERQGVAYTIHHGCLLGATRLHGLLPWDIDTDLFLVGGTGEGFQTRVAVALADHGLALEERWPGRYYVVRPALFFAGRVVPLFPLIEVDLLQESLNAGGETVYDQHASHRRWDAGELLPLRRHAFYGSWLSGPHVAEPVIERLYGGAGSMEAIRPFAPASLPATVDAFWRRARPFDGEMDWPAISERGRRLRRTIVWCCLRGAPWYLLNGLYCIVVQTLRRRAGGHIE